MSTYEDNTQVDSPSLLTSLEDEENAQICIATKQFNKVFWKYLIFLLAIAKSLREITDDEDQKQRKKRKFLAIKKELRNFLIAHKKFYDIYEIFVVKEDCSVIFRKRFSVIDHGNNFLKLEDILKLNEVINEKVRMHTEINKSEVLDAIKLKQGKSVLTTQDVHQFLKNHLFIEKSDINTKCSTYADLKDYIQRRIKDYCNKEVSDENINQMSFRFQGSIEDHEDEKSCAICLNDYKTDQEVCRLPCNHFCCRVCTEKMFSTPNQGLTSNILCPICRDDCT